MRDPRAVRSLAAPRLADAGLAGIHPLGALAYGAPLAGAAAVPVQVLDAPAGRIDAWIGAAALTEGRHGRVRWHHDGQWLFAAIELDESAAHPGLEDVAREVYSALFAVLAETGFPHVLRFWNYLPRINADGGGMERYRQFNAGRQAAFLAAGAAAFDGAPAACAIGTEAGPMCVRMLAGRAPVLAVENPRQVSAYRYPETYGPRSPTFSRAALAPAGPGHVALMISGTASIVGHETMHPGDVLAQLHETLANLRAVVATANTRCAGEFALEDLACVAYVRRAADLPALRAAFAGAVGLQSIAASTAVWLRADICRAELLVEIEAHAIGPGEVPA